MTSVKFSFRKIQRLKLNFGLTLFLGGLFSRDICVSKLDYIRGRIIWGAYTSYQSAIVIATLVFIASTINFKFLCKFFSDLCQLSHIPTHCQIILLMTDYDGTATVFHFLLIDILLRLVFFHCLQAGTFHSGWTGEFTNFI